MPGIFSRVKLQHGLVYLLSMLYAMRFFFGRTPKTRFSAKIHKQLKNSNNTSPLRVRPFQLACLHGSCIIEVYYPSAPCCYRKRWLFRKILVICFCNSHWNMFTLLFQFLFHSEAPSVSEPLNFLFYKNKIPCLHKMNASNGHLPLYFGFFFFKCVPVS